MSSDTIANLQLQIHKLNHQIEELEEKRQIEELEKKRQIEELEKKRQIKELEEKRQIRILENQIEELEEKRNDYLSEFHAEELYNKYVGLYNKKSKRLIINHSCDEYLQFYTCSSCCEFVDEDSYTVKGSWDNWTKEYTIHIQCLLPTIKGTKIYPSYYTTYEGYIAYIIIDEELKDGEEYQYKYKTIYPDEDGDIWVEVDNDGMKPGTDSNIRYIDSEFNQKMIKNEFGEWNACLTVRIGD